MVAVVLDRLLVPSLQAALRPCPGLDLETGKVKVKRTIGKTDRKFEKYFLDKLRKDRERIPPPTIHRPLFSPFLASQPFLHLSASAASKPKSDSSCRFRCKRPLTPPESARGGEWRGGRGKGKGGGNRKKDMDERSRMARRTRLSQ